MIKHWMCKKNTGIKRFLCLAMVGAMTVLAAACGTKEPVADDNDYNDKDFSSYKTPGAMEAAYEYKSCFLPAKDKLAQPYVGDTMPYYEDGTYYIYYLKDGGDSYNHSIYLATTTDFTTFTEIDEPIIESSRDGKQDGWIGTGSMIKVDNEYLFFYTGHASGPSEYKETIMLAKGDSPYSFTKCESFEIIPDPSLKQKNDFRDPEAHVDEATGDIILTVTASKDGLARILKYTVKRDLSGYTYDGIIYDDPIGKVYNLECSDTFRIGNYYYITYSAQDDTLWYARSDKPYGPFSHHERLDNKLFYAPKHVSDGISDYMIGWVRRSESPSSTYEVSAWGGNMATQQIAQNKDGSLYLTPVTAISESFVNSRKLSVKKDGLTIDAGALYNYEKVFTAYESFKLSGTFNFKDNKGSFGLAFDFKKNSNDYKLITISPKDEKIALEFNNGKNLITEKKIKLEPGKDYNFTYIQEGSVGFFYIDGITAFSVRLYGVSGKSVSLYAGNNQVTFSNLKEFTGIAATK